MSGAGDGIGVYDAVGAGAVAGGGSRSLDQFSKEDQDQTRQLIEQLIEQIAPQLEQMPGSVEADMEAREVVVRSIQEYIANIHSEALGVTGIVALVVVAIGLLSTIEGSFNQIWGVRRGRGVVSRIFYYWTAISLGPLIVILAMGTAVSGHFGDAAPGWMRGLLTNLLPFVVLSLVFGLLLTSSCRTRKCAGGRRGWAGWSVLCCGY